MAPVKVPRLMPCGRTCVRPASASPCSLSGITSSMLTGVREFSGHTLFKGEKGVGSPDKPVNRRDKNVRSWYMTTVRLLLYFLDAMSRMCRGGKTTPKRRGCNHFRSISPRRIGESNLQSGISGLTHAYYLRSRRNPISLICWTPTRSRHESESRNIQSISCIRIARHIYSSANGRANDSDPTPASRRSLAARSGRTAEEILSA